MPISADHPKDQPWLKPRSEVVSRAVPLGYFYNYLFLYLTPPYPYATIICRITESRTARILAGHGSGMKMKQPVTAGCMVRRPVNVEIRVNRVDERGGKGRLQEGGGASAPFFMARPPGHSIKEGIRRRDRKGRKRKGRKRKGKVIYRLKSMRKNRVTPRATKDRSLKSFSLIVFLTTDTLVYIFLLMTVGL